MKKLLNFIFLIVFSLALSYAQEVNLIDLDSFDSIFDEPLLENQEPAEGADTVIQNLRRRGIEFTASYEFMGGINPGWNQHLWEFDGEEEFSWALGVKMGSTIGLNAQITEAFRVRSVINYELPEFLFTLGDFYFDYNFFDKVFLRAGKFEQSWGISPNFGFTNLLSRITMIPPVINDIPSDLTGPSYIIKADVPIGIGGFQVLALTRAYVTDGVIPTRYDIGYGGKYNLAFSWADFNLGVFYQYGMATRGFFSAKTTFWDTDFYYEWLFIYNNHLDNSSNISFNIGASKSFFNNKLEINGEYFYNGEEDTEYFVPETNFRKEETSPFLHWHNFALNILYRYGGNWNLRFFTRFLFASTDRVDGNYLTEPSYSLLPGLRITPFNNLDIYFAVPMALGKGYYYRTAENIQHEHRPFSFALFITFSGSVQASHYY